MTLVLGVALGGGAARGLAHLGVLDALHEAGLRPGVIVGTSFGALMGAATLCRGGDARAVEESVVAFTDGEAYRRSKLAFLRGQQGAKASGASHSVREAIRRGPGYGASTVQPLAFPADEMRAAFAMLLPDVSIESLGVRFGAVAADLETGEELLFDRGSLRVSIAASSAIPGLLPPVRAGGRLCVDGGWVEKVPVLAARALGAGIVIAVDVADELGDTRGLLEGPAVIHRADAIQAARLKATQLSVADAVIACDVARFGWADFGQARALAEAGREAARAAMSRVLEAVARANGLGGPLRRLRRSLAGEGQGLMSLPIRRVAAS